MFLLIILLYKRHPEWNAVEPKDPQLSSVKAWDTSTTTCILGITLSMTNTHFNSLYIFSSM